jgi:uncharacterized protein (DUF305 family)
MPAALGATKPAPQIRPALSPPVERNGGLFAAFGILLVSLVAALVIALLRWPAAPAAPADDSAAAGFTRDMQEHHAQAVEMSMIVRDRTRDEDVRRLAFDIALLQQYQIGSMAELLRGWGLRPTGSGPSMAWMGHTGHADTEMSMPGMASAADLEELSRESGATAELRFLRLMIAHHRGGVEMAEAVLALTDVPAVRDMAEKVVFTQNAEVEAMNDLIVERGGKRV